MGKDRTGFIVEIEGKLYARICYTDHAGNRKELKRRASDRTEAKKILKDLQAKLDSADRDQQLQAEKMKFSKLAEIYSERKLIPAEYVGDRKVAGLRSLAPPKLSLRYLVEHFGTQLIQTITHSQVEVYKLKRLRSGLAIASVNRELETLRAVLNFAKREQWLSKTPFELGAPLISKADEARRTRVMSHDEEKKLLLACTDRREHLRPVIIALVDTGMRFGELTTLRWSDVDLPGRTIRIRAYHTKTARARSVPISERLFHELQRLYSERSDLDAVGGLIFGITDNCKKSWKSACKDAGIEGLRIHDLRATFITRLIDAGMEVAETAKISGHTQLQTLYDRYLRPTGNTLERAAILLDSING
jgi:integrase